MKIAILVISVMFSHHVSAQQINARAFTCDPIEFAELNSLDFADLESMYCSSAIGSKRIMDRFNNAPADNSNLASVNQTISLGRSAMAAADKCNRTLFTSGDLQRRKFPDRKFNCEPYKLPQK